MEVKVFKDYAELSKFAANRVLELIQAEPAGVYGLATGSTPLGLYAELIERKAELPDLSQIKTVNLDEYLGLELNHPQSYRYFMREKLFAGLGLKAEQSYFPRAEMKDPEEARAAAREYEAKLQELGQRTVQILGLGENGHIGFNEPDSVFTAPTHLVDLTENTIAANSRFFETEEEVPRQAITMGMAGIFDSKEILLLVSGEQKRAAVQQAVLGPVSPELPASILQLHPNVKLLLDEAAAGDLLTKLK
ncbi:MAG: glucosamine-6-phosphate deaminase [Eubacteriales bacterium]|nr:glucosamine-6-phosphate deaminase [Eubacteriales bacterium]